MNLAQFIETAYYPALSLLSSVLIFTLWKVYCHYNNILKIKLKNNITKLRHEKIETRRSGRIKRLRRTIVSKEIQMDQVRKFNISLGELELASKLKLIASR